MGAKAASCLRCLCRNRRPSRALKSRRTLGPLHCSLPAMASGARSWPLSCWPALLVEPMEGACRRTWRCWPKMRDLQLSSQAQTHGCARSKVNPGLRFGGQREVDIGIADGVAREGLVQLAVGEIVGHHLLHVGARFLLPDSLHEKVQRQVTSLRQPSVHRAWSGVVRRGAKGGVTEARLELR